MGNRKLSQVLAVEAGIKSRWTSVVSDAYKRIQKPALFVGLAKTYTPDDEKGDVLPPEHQRVQATVHDVLLEVRRRGTELFDVTAAKDWANCSARADVVVDGEVLINAAPPTYLLFLEKKLTDLRTFVEKLPVLDPAEEWWFDANASLFKSKPTRTARTAKEQRGIVLYDATPEHPAQTQLITKDVKVGMWETTRMSGAVPAARKQEILDRVEVLLKAVKEAREEANMAAAPDVDLGKTLFEYILKP